MNENPLRTFVDLVDFDTQCRNVQRAIDVCEQELAVLKTRKTLLIRDLAETKALVYQLRKEVDQKEREIKELDEQELAFKRRLDLISSPKEYLSLQHELETLTKYRDQGEDLVLMLWNNLTTMQHEADQKERDAQKIIVSLDAEIAAKQAQLKTLKSGLEEALPGRIEKEQKVPAEWIEKYTSMLTKVDNPVVPVVGESCSGCHNTISYQDLAALQRRKMVPCKNCYRLLYCEEKL